ncbi:hypothetical protein MPSEU_000248500 [Mayamaea pseudoterrestris]|nr:hypothetical protein MPSEU_000248500 [Mayamaea pseudoterrestris]
MAVPSNSFLLPKTLQTCIEEIIDTANLSQAGIRAVLLSTTEGVPLGRVVSEPDVATLHPELLQMMESVLAPAAKQVPVLGMNKLNQVVTLLCKPGSNLGAVRSTAAPLLRKVLEPLRSTLEKSLKPE